MHQSPGGKGGGPHEKFIRRDRGCRVRISGRADPSVGGGVREPERA